MFCYKEDEQRMLDERLNGLIKKYKIYDAAEISRDPKIIKGKWKNKMALAIGFSSLAMALNRELNSVKDTRIALYAEVGTLRKIIWRLLSPTNKKKIRFVISVGNDSFHNRQVIESWEIGKNCVDTILTIDFHCGTYANLLGQNFSGQVIDLCSVIYAYHLEQFFSKHLLINPYVNIFISKRLYNKAILCEEKQVWHKRLIAYYLQARDFLSTEKEISKYINDGYADADVYSSFWDEVKSFLREVREQLSGRTDGISRSN